MLRAKRPATGFIACPNGESLLMARSGLLNAINDVCFEGVKRTSAFAVHMSAIGPKRT